MDINTNLEIAYLSEIYNINNTFMHKKNDKLSKVDQIIFDKTLNNFDDYMLEISKELDKVKIELLKEDIKNINL